MRNDLQMLPFFKLSRRETVFTVDKILIWKYADPYPFPHHLINLKVAAMLATLCHMLNTGLLFEEEIFSVTNSVSRKANELLCPWIFTL